MNPAEQREGSVLDKPPKPVDLPREGSQVANPSRRRFLEEAVRWGKAISVLSMVGGVGVELHKLGIVQRGLEAVAAFLRTRRENIARIKALQDRPLGPQDGEEAYWWQELSEERIRELAQLPEINQIGDKYVSTVSPALQEQARQAGYKLIYQGDPNDTVGRTVITKGREIDTYWATHDLGFGLAGLHTRGIFKAWVPDPTDPQQKNKVYAILEDPIKKSQFIVAIDLYPYNPNTPENLPTFFYVDNLSYGPDYIREKSNASGLTVGLQGYMVPDPEDPPNQKWKAPKYRFDQVFYELLRVKGYNLHAIAKPGDYVDAGLGFARVSEEGKSVSQKDERGVGRVGSFIVRRFGGFKQWQAEVGKK